MTIIYVRIHASTDEDNKQKEESVVCVPSFFRTHRRPRLTIYRSYVHLFSLP